MPQNPHASSCPPNSASDSTDPDQARTEPTAWPMDLMDMAAVHGVHRLISPVAKYFRYEARHFERVPSEPTLVVANHSGGKLPIDMFLFGCAWFDHFEFGRELRPLLHDFLFSTAWSKDNFARLGCAPAHPANARALLAGQKDVLVLPGGDYETFRPFSQRYKIDFEQRTGFVSLALQSKVPITPLVTVGSHELFFVVRRGQRLANWLGLRKQFRCKSCPIVLGLPFGLYLGPVPSPFPLPAKITSEVLEPIRLHEAEHDHRAYDQGDLAVAATRLEMQALVVRRMQAAMDRLAGERRFAILG